MEKLDKVIAALEELVRPDYECMGCPCRAYEVERDALEWLRALSEELADRRKDIEVQGEIIRELKGLDGDLISRSALLAELKRWEWGLPEHEVECAVAAVHTVAAEPVIRCKDCQHYGGVAFGNVCRRWSAPLAGMKNCTKPDDFCSYGERRTNDEPETR